MPAVLDVQGSRSDNMSLSPTSLRNRAAEEHKRARTSEDRAAAQERLRGMARQQGVYHRKVRLCLNGLLSDAREAGWRWRWWWCGWSSVGEGDKGNSYGAT